jgi:hypothetical protein
MFGRPAKVADAHVPVTGGVAVVAAADPDVEAEDEEAPLDEADEAEPAGWLTDEGAVGRSRLVLFENWQPVRSTDAARATVNARVLFVMTCYAFVRAHTIVSVRLNETLEKFRETEKLRKTVQKAGQDLRARVQRCEKLSHGLSEACTGKPLRHRPATAAMRCF